MNSIIAALLVVSVTTLIIYFLLHSNKKKKRSLKQEDNDDVKLSLYGTFECDSYPYSSSKEDFKFMASIRGPSYRINSKNRSGIDLLCIIDKSSSMNSDDRMNLVKYTVKIIINTFLKHRHDRLGIIVFSNSSSILLPLIELNENKESKSRALNVINSIYCTGSTALCDGLVEGINLMKSNKKSKNLVRSIFLFTDGEANIGKTKNEEIIYEIMKIKEGMNCTINTFGCGNNHNANLLQSISEQGNNGLYAFINSEKIIAKTLAECIGGLMGIIAQNINVNIESANNRIKITNILSNGYEYEYESDEGEGDNHNTCNFKKVVIKINDIQSEENRDLLFELKIPKIDNKMKKYDLIKLSVDYINIIKDKKEIISKICSISRNDENKENEQEKQSNIDLDIQCNRLKAANCMIEADKAANNGDLDNAKKILQSAQITIQNSVSSRNKFCQNLIKDIDQCLENMNNELKYKNDGNKMLKMNAKCHQMQRSCQAVSWSSQKAYVTTIKACCIDEVD